MLILRCVSMSKRNQLKVFGKRADVPPVWRRVGLSRQVRPVSGFAARAGACVQKVRAGVHACMFVRRVDAQT